MQGSLYIGGCLRTCSYKGVIHLELGGGGLELHWTICRLRALSHDSFPKCASLVFSIRLNILQKAVEAVYKERTGQKRELDGSLELNSFSVFCCKSPNAIPHEKKKLFGEFGDQIWQELISFCFTVLTVYVTRLK